MTLAAAKREGWTCHALTVAYGQRHRVELQAALKVARQLGADEHRLVRVDLDILGGSALTDALEVPKDAEGAPGIPITYVPARNTVFLSLALGYAEVVDSADLFLGVNAVDYSGYPDCRQEFLTAFESLASVATKAGVEGRRFQVHAPLVTLSKAEIIRMGIELGVDFSLTHSCYDPDPQGRACGHCDSCLIRSRGFREAGVEDPAWT